jgi:hypothetical protein
VESDVQAEALIDDYLGRLQAASWPLPAGRRAELSDEVAEHIEAALAEAGRHDEVTVRNVLERLGPPEEIVAAEGVDTPDAATGERGGADTAVGMAARSPWGAVEIIAAPSCFRSSDRSSVWSSSGCRPNGRPVRKASRPPWSSGSSRYRYCCCSA